MEQRQAILGRSPGAAAEVETPGLRDLHEMHQLRRRSEFTSAFGRVKILAREVSGARPAKRPPDTNDGTTRRNFRWIMGRIAQKMKQPSAQW